MDKTEIDMMKEAQWFTCKILKDKAPESYQGWFKKGMIGYACVLENDSVIIWRGKGLWVTFGSIEKAKIYATCLNKVQNKANDAITAWNKAMY